MIGKTISRYKIIEKIGEGGMGVVYKAEDTRLKRIVALKFPPPQMLDTDGDKKRFSREAQAAAALDHPNICTVYEIDSAGEYTFISMAYIDGHDLREKVEQGPVKVETALDISLQIAEGLHAAHEKHIVHRDIKTANIMLTDRGRVKIMDFGLAKPVGGEQVTKEVSTMGTVAYMSPEQTRGDSVDQRTDIWSLGVVMYEMLAGRRPFHGDYEQSVIYAIVNEDPEPVTALRTGVPMDFERIIGKCLAKSPKNRYQNIEDVIVDLRRLKTEIESKEILSRTGIRPAPGKSRVRSVLVSSVLMVAAVVILFGYFSKFGQREAVGAQIPIAVADFSNETGEPELDGLSGMLITSLEQSRRLSVLTRSRMFDVLDQMGQEDVDRIDESLGREICREASINILVVASIRKFDDLYTIDLKTFDMVNNTHLFTTKADGRGRGSIPGMIDDLARDTRRGLKERSGEIQAASEHVAQITTPNIEAYQHYFLGEQHVDKLQFKKAQTEFTRAVEMDSTFALAYYRLAYTSWWYGAEEEVQRADMEKAIGLMERLPEKYRFLLQAQANVIEQGYDAGIEILKDGERFYPDDKEIVYNIGDYSFHAQQYAQADSYLTRVLDMDPSFQRAIQHLYMNYTATGEYLKALAMAKRYADLAGTEVSVIALSTAYLQTGDVAGATETLARSRDQYPESRALARQTGVIYLLSDEYDKAEAIFDSLATLGEKADHKNKMALDQRRLAVRMYKGQYREALAMMDQAIEFSLEQGDSFTAVTTLMREPYIYFLGWNDTESIRAVSERLSLFEAYVKTVTFYDIEPVFWASLASTHILAGEIDQSREIIESKLAGHPASRYQAMFYLASVEGSSRMFAYADSVANTSPPRVRLMLQWILAEFYLNNDDPDKTIEALEVVQNWKDLEGPLAVLYPPSYYLMGQAFEKKGDTVAAISSYEYLLGLWKDADPDLIPLVDTKQRLEKLIAASTQ